jgi:hypothetical protein
VVMFEMQRSRDWPALPSLKRLPYLEIGALVDSLRRSSSTALKNRYVRHLK